MYKYNPLLVAKLDKVGADRLNDIGDVSAGSAIDGKGLVWNAATSKWVPETADFLLLEGVSGTSGNGGNAGDMYKSTYDTNDDGVVDNSERLEGEALATVQAHNVAASKITSGTFGLARIPTIDNDHLAGEITSDKIPALNGTALSYPLNADTVGTTAIKSAGVGNAELAASGLDISKFTVGTAGVARIPSLPTARITTGTFNLNRVPAVDDARIPNLETLSYGAAFAAAQIPNLAASKITSGTVGLARIPGTLTGKDADTVDGADAGVAADKVFKIPAGIAQGDIFHVNAGGSVVNLSAGTSGHFLKTYGAGTNPAWASVPGGGDMLKSVYDTDDDGIVDNSERLGGNTLGSVQDHNIAAAKITSGTIGLARIPSIDDVRIPDLETLSYGAAFAAGQIPNLAASKITTGTFGLARIPSIDDARIPNLETLSYGGAFATAQIPAIGAYKITSGTLAVARQETLDNLNGTVALSQIPTMDDAHIPDLDSLSYGAAFAEGQIPNISASKTTTGTFNANRIPILPTDRYGSAVLLTGAQSIGGTKTFSDIPILPASDPTADNEAARKAYVDSAAAGDIDGGIYSDTYVNTADIDGGTF